MKAISHKNIRETLIYAIKDTIMHFKKYYRAFLQKTNLKRFAFLLFMVLESLSSEFQHFGIKVSSKSMALFWFYYFLTRSHHQLVDYYDQLDKVLIGQKSKEIR